MSTPATWLSARSLSDYISRGDTPFTPLNVTSRCAMHLSRRGIPSAVDEKNAMALPIAVPLIVFFLLVIVFSFSFCRGARNTHPATHTTREAGRNSHDTLWDVDIDWSEDDLLDHAYVKDMPFSYVFSANKVRAGMPPYKDKRGVEKGRWSKRISGVLGSIPTRKRSVDEACTPGSKRTRWSDKDEAACV